MRLTKEGELIYFNSFKSPVSRSAGSDFSDDLVEKYELVDKVVPGASGESSDFTIEKEPVLVESYHLNKVLSERAKGCDLKSIIARVSQTGDMSLLQQREAVYGDITKQPDNLSDALQKGVETANFLDSLSDEEKANYLRLAKMSKSEFDAYIKGLVAEQTKSNVVEEGEQK